MQEVQKELNRYMLPQNYGKKESKANYFTSETEEYIERYNTSEDNIIETQSLQSIFTTHFIS